MWKTWGERWSAPSLTDLLAHEPEEERPNQRRRPPAVAVRDYRCPACAKVHEARCATLPLGCDGRATP